MNVAKILQQRQQSWGELERLCDSMQLRGRTEKSVKRQWKLKRKTASKIPDANHSKDAVAAVTDPVAAGAPGVVKFASLYRSACADLALSRAYQMPPSTEAYLQRLVARAHNQLYRSESMDPRSWATVLFTEAPQRIFRDPCVRLAAIVFFGLFTLSMLMARNETHFQNFATSVVGVEQLEAVEEMYREPLVGSLDHYVNAAAFYIRHNTAIGLVCFGLGILVLPCLFQLAFNAVTLGTTFGYMARSNVDGSENFFHFVTAHGPFELTAIVLAAAAGLKLGVGLFHTNGLTRVDSVRLAGFDALPIMASSAALFVLAALTEGFLSPSPLPYLVKCGWAIFSSGLISFYFVVLGFPRQEASRLLSGSTIGQNAESEQ